MKQIRFERNKNIRIDKYLSDKLGISRTIILKYIKSGDILVNKKIVKPSYKLKYNDNITFLKEISLEKEFILKPAKIPLDIIYEDKNIIVINKQRGLVVHPAPGNFENTLVNALIYYKKELAKTDDFKRPGIVHRLDKDTSGAIVIAKNYETLRFLQKAWKDKEVEKIYLALVRYAFEEKEGKIDIPLFKANQKIVVSAGIGKDAITYFKVLKNYKDYSLLQLKIITGRTHQIRVHLKYINHPIVGDQLYSKKCKDIALALHSFKLTIPMIDENTKKTFIAPLPEDFLNILYKLKKGDKIC